MLARVLSLLGLLLSTHLEMARREAGRDARRLLAGLLLLGAGLALVGAAALLGQGLLVWLVHDTWPVSWQAAVLAVSGGDLLAGIVVAAWARRVLGRPILVETRALARRTAAALGEG